MKISEKYLETLKSINDWTTVSDWTIQFAKQYPDLLAKAQEEAIHHKKPSTGLREIQARISSWVSTGGFGESIEVDDSQRPRLIKFVTQIEKAKVIEKLIEEDAEPLNRAERIYEDEKNLNQKEKYRMAEIFDIAKTMSRMFRLDFEVDHALALLHESKPGKHHPDNFQILTKAHNVRKSNSNWVRFSFEEQIEYMKSVIRVQKIIEQKMAVELDESLIENIIARLKLVY